MSPEGLQALPGLSMGVLERTESNESIVHVSLHKCPWVCSRSGALRTRHGCDLELQCSPIVLEKS